MKELVVAIGLVLFIEGLIYGGFPGELKKFAAQLQKIPEQQLRVAGFIAMFAGLILVWLMY